jgi:hypothetical protein
MRRPKAAFVVAAAVAALGVGLAACQPAGGNTTVAAASAAPPASTTPVAGAGASAANGTPAQFVQRLFAVYASSSEWWADPDTDAGRKTQAAYQKQVYGDFYDPTFVKLMNDNGALAGAKGGGVDLDYDPVCQCQDSGGAYRYLSGAENGAYFEARVTDNEQGQQPWTLVLENTPGGWRIWDVVDTSGSLRTWLGKHNACLAAAKTEKQGEACIS